MVQTLETSQEVERYVEEYARIKDELGEAGPAWLQSVRDAAIERFAELGFPTR